MDSSSSSKRSKQDDSSRDANDDSDNGYIQLHPSLHHDCSRSWTEPTISAKNLMFPLFVTMRENEQSRDIAGFEPNKQWSYGIKFNKDSASTDFNGFHDLVAYIEKLVNEKGLKSVMLFGVIDNNEKDPSGSIAYSPYGPVPQACRILRKKIPDLYIACDVCLCEYTSHGHCGVLKAECTASKSSNTNGDNLINDNHQVCGDLHDESLIDNDNTLPILAKAAIAYAQAGAHMVCPSDMMDGRVGAIRKALNQAGFSYVSIMAYTSKKASSMYAPFRAAVASTFTGHRKRYQQPIGSRTHALRALDRDASEGADVVLVKPALFYCDIISAFSRSEIHHLPVSAYVVSGEYVMLKDYAKRAFGGDLEAVLKESHLSLMRAGTSIIITYFTPELLDYIKKW